MSLTKVVVNSRQGGPGSTLTWRGLRPFCVAFSHTPKLFLEHKFVYFTFTAFTDMYPTIYSYNGTCLVFYTTVG